MSSPTCPWLRRSCSRAICSASSSKRIRVELISLARNLKIVCFNFIMKKWKTINLKKKLLFGYFLNKILMNQISYHRQNQQQPCHELTIYYFTENLTLTAHCQVLPLKWRYFGGIKLWKLAPTSASSQSRIATFISSLLFFCFCLLFLRFSPSSRCWMWPDSAGHKLESEIKNWWLLIILSMLKIRVGFYDWSHHQWAYSDFTNYDQKGDTKQQKCFVTSFLWWINYEGRSRNRIRTGL